jgi:hypothetical protein
VTGLGNDALAEREALEEAKSSDSPSNHSEDENVPEDNWAADDSLKSSAEQAVENQERAIETGEELPG